MPAERAPLEGAPTRGGRQREPPLHTGADSNVPPLPVRIAAAEAAHRAASRSRESTDRRLGLPVGVHISSSTQPLFFLGLILSVGLQSLLAKINMLIQLLTYRAEKWAQVKTDEFPSGHKLMEGEAHRGKMR